MYIYIYIYIYIYNFQNDVFPKWRILQRHRLPIQTLFITSCSFGAGSCRNRQQMPYLWSLAGGNCLCVSRKVVLWSIYFYVRILVPMSYLNLWKCGRPLSQRQSRRRPSSVCPFRRVPSSSSVRPSVHPVVIVRPLFVCLSVRPSVRPVVRSVVVRPLSVRPVVR